MAWPYGADGITLAQEVEERFQRLDMYLTSNACRHHEAALERCIGGVDAYETNSNLSRLG
jgi:hypothetical protein